MYKLLPGKVFAPGSRIEIEPEKRLDKIKFKVHKFNNRPRPSKDRVVIFPSFAEFGSEIVSSIYIIPQLLSSRYVGRYAIVMGWHGREYLYRHLVDEFWEIDPSCQWLREYCLALHHESINLKKLEKQVSVYGQVISSGEIGNVCVTNDCFGCLKKYGGLSRICPHCGSKSVNLCLFADVVNAKRKATWIPKPSNEKLELVNKYLTPNSVGITARARRCYGRNLPPIFYKRLIYLLEDMGYRPIWLGEKQTTLPCPVPGIVDFSRMEESADLETTLALVSKLKFTVQFWTASTRLAGIVGTPYIIFESPEQIWGKGQEGMRLHLCTKGNSKIIVAHYLRVLQEQSLALNILKQGILEIENDNYDSLVGLVQNPEYVKKIIQQNNSKIGKVNNDAILKYGLS